MPRPTFVRYWSSTDGLTESRSSPAPTAEMHTAVAKAQRGLRATLPNLPESALLGNAVELPSCPVCLERARDTAFMPCGHRVCAECARTNWRR